MFCACFLLDPEERTRKVTGLARVGGEASRIALAEDPRHWSFSGVGRVLLRKRAVGSSPGFVPFCMIGLGSSQLTVVGGKWLSFNIHK